MSFTVASQEIQTAASLVDKYSFDITVRVTLSGVTYTYSAVTRKINAVY